LASFTSQQLEQFNDQLDNERKEKDKAIAQYHNLATKFGILKERKRKFEQAYHQVIANQVDFLRFIGSSKSQRFQKTSCRGNSSS
jgi:hypothetical protein